MTQDGHICKFCGLHELAIWLRFHAAATICVRVGCGGDVCPSREWLDGMLSGGGDRKCGGVYCATDEHVRAQSGLNCVRGVSNVASL